jgi:hypothetical protein
MTRLGSDPRSSALCQLPARRNTHMRRVGAERGLAVDDRPPTAACFLGHSHNNADASHPLAPCTRAASGHAAEPPRTASREFSREFFEKMAFEADSCV